MSGIHREIAEADGHLPSVLLYRAFYEEQFQLECGRGCTDEELCAAVEGQLAVDELFPPAVVDSLVALADVDVKLNLVLDAEGNLVDLE